MSRPSPTIKIFLAGDVMTGRGIDQILPHSCDPRIYEDYCQSATDYVALAEEATGEIPRPATLSYVWGAALAELERVRPDARVVNLETSITRSESYAPKGVNYRMSPENAGCLVALGVDCCALANNHVLDWGRAGLIETLETLERLNVKTAGAGRTLAEAWRPAVLDIAGKGRLLVFSVAFETSGAPPGWVARDDAPGIALLSDFSERSVALIADEIAGVRRENDIVVLSVHWGGNWGYDVPAEQQWFARRLIEEAPIAVVHGHSSHHAKGIEVYRNRLILYGCGDFLNDYEGIRGQEEYRGDLAAMYFAQIDAASGELVGLRITPLRIRHFQLTPAPAGDVDWMRATLDRESRRFGARVEAKPDGTLALFW